VPWFDTPGERAAAVAAIAAVAVAIIVLTEPLSAGSQNEAKPVNYVGHAYRTAHRGLAPGAHLPVLKKAPPSRRG